MGILLAMSEAANCRASPKTKQGGKRVKRQHIGLASATVLALALMPTLAAAQFYSDVQDNGPLHLKAQGTFFITGTPAFVTGIESGRNPPVAGNRQINQMAVQFMKPQ